MANTTPPLRVPFVDLQAQHRALRAELSAAIERVMDKCDFILGEAVGTFEAEFAQFVGAAQGIGVASGFDALRLSLQVAGVGAGDEVIVPAHTFIATALAVSALGARPVLVDVDETTYNLDCHAIEAAITPRTRAILPVHLYGQACDMEEIMRLAHQRHLAVIEDACQAHGARYQGRGVGTFGLTGCFSFYASKNLGACGDGGIIVTDDAAVAARLRILRNCGQREKYEHVDKGINSRLDTLQAAILRVKLKELARWNALRAQHARDYAQRLAAIPGLQLPRTVPDRTHVFHLYVVRVPQRAALQQHLTEQGIQTMIHYPRPLHLHAAFADLGYRRGQFPVSEKLADEILSLPMFPELTTAQIAAVCETIRGFLSRCQDPG